MLQYKKKFHLLLWIKESPNEYEVHLFERAQKYIQKLSRIPGIEMIAVVNSLSMYATHKDSDIDLFIVTQPGMIWFVRFFSTCILWKNRVWRKNEDIAGNFCLSFFITTEALDFSKIAIENDIYLYYWIYFLKPIFEKNNTYEKFLEANNWVQIDEDQKIENQKYVIKDIPTISSLFLFSRKKKEYFYKKINQLIRFFLLPKTLKSYKKLWNPEWIIISDIMLKFHNEDMRTLIRDRILEKNFDK
jgi:hypothetical protein